MAEKEKEREKSFIQEELNEAKAYQGNLQREGSILNQRQQELTKQLNQLNIELIKVAGKIEGLENTQKKINSSGETKAPQEEEKLKGNNTKPGPEKKPL